MSAIHKFTGNPNSFQWESVLQEIPTMEGLKHITKQILVGGKEGASHFSIRYFRVQGGGHTKLEQHAHEHGIIILHGRGRVQIGEKVHEIESFDSLYISGNELHQFTNPYEEPFGFICVIPLVE